MAIAPGDGITVAQANAATIAARRAADARNAEQARIDAAVAKANKDADKALGVKPTNPINPTTPKKYMPGDFRLAEEKSMSTPATEPEKKEDLVQKQKEEPATRTLAIDTFRNTLALFFGAEEVKKGWVNALYNSTSKFYNSGSTIDESLNLSLQDVRNNPELKEFTNRFKGIYALQDRLAKGEAIEVPTIAEYFKSESAMGDVLREAGMGDLATQDFLGGVLGLGKSVLEVTNLISETFAAIDNAPTALKEDLKTYFPGVSRTDIAKALLTGTEGAAALNKKIAGISTLSAAKSQGVTVDLDTASDIAARGYDYNKSLTGFADVKRLERGQMLGKMSGIDLTQKETIAATFEGSVQAADKIAKIREEEENRFAGRSGRLASQNRSSGLI
jgi:hypothetical protein